MPNRPHASRRPVPDSYPSVMRTTLACVAGLVALTAGSAAQTIRVATFNLEDVRTRELLDGNSPRLRRLAEVIQRLRPNVILLNEITYDMPGGPDVPEGQQGRNARRFADFYLGLPQTDDLASGPDLIRYEAFMAPTNTGVPSGFDLDNSGEAVRTFPFPAEPGAELPEAERARAQAFANDCWGFGTFPGQYGMGLLVDSRLRIRAEQARTFRKLPWSYMDGAAMPVAADGKLWYSEEEAKYFRLSSKSHWDVPVELPGGAVVHFLCSHPTPPAFDGPEQRNKRRNHDEIRFWADYVNDTGGYIVDDSGVGGGLPRSASFVVLGDLNADPERGDSYRNPILNQLGSVKRLNLSFVPRAEVPAGEPGPGSAVTSAFGLRVDYVLPSKDLIVERGGVWTSLPSGTQRFPSDHFPVWVELTVPPP
ncbi:MAG: endonuclease/exonuclease/phosphatase family protein [Leptolyngbya sp. PLA1]|nr:endonuclease/exonuclease/phosphatase family protein [Leptolyngbya sp. PLA1]